MTTRRRPSDIRAYITLEVFDSQGKRTGYRRFRSRSFTQAFLAILLVQMSNAGVQPSVPAITNVSSALLEEPTNFKIVTAAAALGVVVGSGSTAVVVTDYALGTIIGDGTGSGQLSHGLQVISSLSVSDPNASFTVRRDFTNSSGASITVNEVGLYGHCQNAESITSVFLMLRDIIAGGQAVADGSTLRVTYTIQTST